MRLFGKKLDEAAKNRIGYMPEERGLYRDLKLEPTLVYLATLKGMSESAARVQLVDWLKRLDLYEHRQKKTQDLSRGMQQKAQLIATLLHDPDLIVVDEPFANLDPVNTRLALEILEEQRQAGKAIIMSTHLMFQVEAMCNRIVLIDRGKSVLYGEVDQIKRDFATDAILVEGQGDFKGLPGVLDVRQENSHWRLVAGAGRRAADGLPRAGRPRRGEDRALRAGRAVAGRHLRRGGAADEGTGGSDRRQRRDG